MAANNNKVSIPRRDFYGSRFRCLLLTHQPRDVVANNLTELVKPYATVDPNQDRWMPAGFLNPRESELDRTGDFLSTSQKEVMTNWWLAVPRGKRPTWDIVSTCTVDGRPGLILIEAKAHVDEMSADGQASTNSPNSRKNRERIAAAVAESNNELDAIQPGFNMSIESHYQLSNRFAWSWKIASLGIPVVLVYLGFLNADDMDRDGREIFDSASSWKRGVYEYALDTVPEQAWERELDIQGTPVIPLIRSMDMQ
jgi:hypothetical protein